MRRLALDDHQIPVGPDRELPARRFQLGELEFDDAFDQMSEPRRFAVVAARRRIDVEFLEAYPCAQVFAPRNAECICFEPMTARERASQRRGPARAGSRGRSRASFSIRVRDLPAGR